MQHKILLEIIVDDWDGTPEETISRMCRDWSACIDDWNIISQEVINEQ